MRPAYPATGQETPAPVSHTRGFDTSKSRREMCHCPYWCRTGEFLQQVVRPALA
jgi:hypothetical protein